MIRVNQDPLVLLQFSGDDTDVTEETSTSRGAITASTTTVNGVLESTTNAHDVFYIDVTDISDGDLVLTLKGDSDELSIAGQSDTPTGNQVADEVSIGDSGATQEAAAGIITLSDIDLGESVPRALIIGVGGSGVEVDTDGRKKLRNYGYLYVKNRAGYASTVASSATDTQRRGDDSYIEYTSVSYVGPDNDNDDTDTNDDETVRVEFVHLNNYEDGQDTQANALEGKNIALGIWGTYVTDTVAATDHYYEDARGTLEYRGPLLGSHLLTAIYETGTPDGINEDGERQINFVANNIPEIAIVVDFGRADDPFTYQIADAELKIDSATYQEDGSPAEALAPFDDGNTADAGVQYSETSGLATLTLDGSGTVNSGKLTGGLDRVKISFTDITLDLAAETAANADNDDVETTISATDDSIIIDASSQIYQGDTLHGWFFSDNRPDVATTDVNEADLTAALAGIVTVPPDVYNMRTVTDDDGTESQEDIELPGVDVDGDDIADRTWTFTHELLGVFLAEKR